MQVLGCSESMTSQNRNLVIRMVQEHLSLEVTKTPRPNEGLPGPAFDPMTYRTKCILGGLSEGNTAIWQKGKTTAIVATESWECPQFLKSRSGKWILVKTSIPQALSSCVVCVFEPEKRERRMDIDPF